MEDATKTSVAPVPQTHSISSHLIQLAGAVAIVAFHTNAPGSQAGWMAVELFFVAAGMNMASALKRQPPLTSYAWARARRLLPEVSVIWLIVILALILGKGTAGMAWFAGTAPFFLQNLTPPFFDYDLPKDAVFGPLWFIGALFQLQVILYASRKLWETASPVRIIAAVFAIGLLLRLSFILISSQQFRSLSVGDAESLYCMPFCHLEAIVLGILMGRGSLPAIGRWFPLFLSAILIAGALNLWLSAGRLSLGSLGYEFPLRANGSRLWGYPLLALAAASLCARDGPLARAVDGIHLSPRSQSLLAKLVAPTFGIYVFHGLVIALGLNGARFLENFPPLVSNSLVFVITLLEAAALAALFIVARHWLFKKLRWTEDPPVK